MKVGAGIIWWWRRRLGWFPIQPCLMCGRFFWAGMPRRKWTPDMEEFCSRQCADDDLEMLGVLMRDREE